MDHDTTQQSEQHAFAKMNGLIKTMLLQQQPNLLTCSLPEQIHINPVLWLLAAVAMVVVVTGFLLCEHSLDRGTKKSVGGGIVTFGVGSLGLVLISALQGQSRAAVSHDTDHCCSVAWKSTPWAVGSSVMALVVVASSVLFHKFQQIPVVLAGPAVAWIAYSVVGGFGSNGTFDPARFGLLLTGAGLILGGMVALLWQRQSSTRSVYGPGLPLFTLGWVLVATGIAKEEPTQSTPKS